MPAPRSVRTRRREMRFANKVAVVTGAARGIGRACAERFLSEGAKVVLGDIDAPTLNKTAAAIGTSDKVLAVVTAVSRKEQVVALIGAAVKQFGRFDIMVNNAGIAPVQDFLDVSEADFDRVLAVNLKVTLTCRRSIPASPLRA